MAFTFNIDSRGTGRLVFDLPGEKVNKLSVSTLGELEKQLDELALNKEIKVLLITSGKPDLFIAGADLNSFGPAFEKPELIGDVINAGHRTFKKLAALPFPTIAVIHGTCLGGGLELALACTYRVVSDHPKTILGLPEVTLGIFPGWGGTQRLPRLIGLEEGLQMILSGKPVKAYKAWKIKLADALLPWEFLDQKVEEFVTFCLKPEGKAQILNKRKPHGLRHFILEQNPLGRAFLFWLAKKNLLKKTKGHYPAHLAALELVQATSQLPLSEGLQIEAQRFTGNITGIFKNAKNLISLFFISESLKKHTGVPTTTIPRKINTAAVLGAGTMGGAIAWLFSFFDYPVRLKDINWEAISKGYETINQLYVKFIKDKKLKKTEANLKFHHVSATTDYSGFQNVDIVIEAIVENLQIKKQTFAELEEKIRPDTIIASNTSSLTIAEMSSEAKHPERFVGMHFFNPPNRMPLVEVVAGPKTSPEAIATAVDLCKKLGKTPVVVGDCHGFLINRIFALGANETLWMLEEGIPMHQIDAMMLNFGMPMAPFVLADEVGNDVTYKVAKVFEEAYGPRMSPPKLLKELYERKLFGKKTGKGFYLYKGKNRKPNPEINALITASKKEGVADSELQDRVLLVMINEAARCLKEKVIENPGFLDMALIMGIGFPPFRGGLLRYADEMGIDTIVNRLSQFEKQYGVRFTACELLLEMQRNHGKFYSS